jgi:hypothetical protein
MRFEAFGAAPRAAGHRTSGRRRRRCSPGDGRVGWTAAWRLALGRDDAARSRAIESLIEKRSPRAMNAGAGDACERRADVVARRLDQRAGAWRPRRGAGRPVECGQSRTGQRQRDDDQGPQRHVCGSRQSWHGIVASFGGSTGREWDTSRHLRA